MSFLKFLSQRGNCSNIIICPCFQEKWFSPFDGKKALWFDFAQTQVNEKFGHYIYHTRCDDTNCKISTPLFFFIFAIYEVHMISFQTFFVWALLLIVHTWNYCPLQSNLLRLQCTCCTVPTTSRRPHGSPLVSACQWLSSQPLSSPQLSHNDSFWA